MLFIWGGPVLEGPRRPNQYPSIQQLERNPLQPTHIRHPSYLRVHKLYTKLQRTKEYTLRLPVRDGQSPPYRQVVKDTQWLEILRPSTDSCREETLSV
jgi:hypothetical protein